MFLAFSANIRQGSVIDGIQSTATPLVLSIAIGNFFNRTACV
jgi:hypothetical protein